MTAVQTTLGTLAVLIGTISYIPYFRDIFRGKTKPHAFTWGLWGVLTGIAWAAQVAEGAGPGAWVTGATALACFAIAALALAKGKREFPAIDWIFLTSAIVALYLWWLTDTPLYSVILITVTDTLSFGPTLRKSIAAPHEETVSTFALSAVKFTLGIIALDSFAVVNWLYPASLILQNGFFSIWLIARRKKIPRP